MNQILPWAANFAALCVILAMACAAVRMMRGPSAQDRVVALDAFYVNGMLLVLIQGLRFGSALYFEIALLLALFGFVGSIAMAKFLLRGEVIEP